MKTQHKDLKKFATGGLPNIVINDTWYQNAPNVFVSGGGVGFFKGIPNHQWTLTPNDWVSAYKVHGLASVRQGHQGQTGS